MPFPSPGDLPDPGIKSALQADYLLSEPAGSRVEIISKSCEVWGIRPPL